MRVSWVDALKGFAIIGVAFGHVAAGYHNRGMFPEQAFILQSIWDFWSAFFMPLFFLASGYLYEMTWNEKGKVSLAKIKNKFFDLGSLYVLYSLLFWSIKYASGIYVQRGITDVQMVAVTTIWDLILIPIKPYSYLWFLWVLTALFLIIPVLSRYIHDRRILVGAFAVGYLFPWKQLLMGGQIDISGTAALFFWGGLYFSAGSWLRMVHFEALSAVWRRILFIAAGCICLCNMGLYFFAGGSIWTGSIHAMVIAVSSCYVIWYVLVWWDKKKWIGSQFLQLCGEKSLQIYLLHLYFVGPLRTIFYKIGMDNLLFLIAAATVLAVVGPLGIGYICERNKYLAYLFHPADALRKWI